MKRAESGLGQVLIMKQSKLLSVVLILATMLFILSSSIAAATCWKGFYYLQIDNLNLIEETGLTREEIKTAYSEMVDFCNGVKDEFSVGKLHYSESGKDHFVDCQKLFTLDLRILGISTCVLLLWAIVRRFVKVRSSLILGHNAGFWGAACLLVTAVVLTGLGSINFDRTFVIFHTLFFPGKTNWYFDPRVDEVINILPEVFFMRCAILIVCVLLLECTVLIVSDLVLRKKQKEKQAE